MFFALILALSIDSSAVPAAHIPHASKKKMVEIDYLGPIDHWIDSAMRDGPYERALEHRHLQEKNHRDGWLDPTWHKSPFNHRKRRV